MSVRALKVADSGTQQQSSGCRNHDDRLPTNPGAPLLPCAVVDTANDSLIRLRSQARAFKDYVFFSVNFEPPAALPCSPARNRGHLIGTYLISLH